MMPTSTDLTQLKIYHASTDAVAEAAIAGGQVDPNSLIITDEYQSVVLSIGNQTGAILLVTGLTISGKTLSCSISGGVPIEDLR